MEAHPFRSGIRHPVSIVIATVNEQDVLPRLLTSLLGEDKRRLEILVVDGASDDGTREVVERIQFVAPANVRIRLISSATRDVSAQRNQGADAADHDTILFLDADAVIECPRELDTLVQQFRRSRATVASCRFRPHEYDPLAWLCYGLLHLAGKAVERWRPLVIGACILVRKRAFRRCGGFDPRRRRNAVAEFCLACGRLGRFQMLPVSIAISSRRFAKGYWRTTLELLCRTLEQG